MNISIKNIEFDTYNRQVKFYLNVLDVNLPYRFKADLILDKTTINDVEFYFYGADGGTKNYLYYHNPRKNQKV